LHGLIYYPTAVINHMQDTRSQSCKHISSESISQFINQSGSKRPIAV